MTGCISITHRDGRVCVLCHDVGDVLEHLKGEHIEVRGILITVSDSFSKCIEILINIPMKLNTINTRNGGRWQIII